MHIGIDFGTTNTTVAWFNPKRLQLETIKIAGEDGDKVPSVVYWDEKPSNCLYGKAAANKRDDIENNKKIREEFKPLLGIENQLHRVRMADLMEGFLGWLKKKIIECTGCQNDAKIQVTLTHPVAWAERQIKVLKDAASQVGFVVTGTMEEPIAACDGAVAIGMNLGDTVLVFDLGGGTLDLALLTKRVRGVYAPVDKCRVDGMAGSAFDKTILEKLNEQCVSVTGKSLDDVPYNKKRVREMKERLSKIGSTSFSTLFPKFECKVTKGDLKGFLREFLGDVDGVHNIRILLKDFIERNKERGYNIDTVLLVGGSTQMPIIQELVESVTGIKPIRHPQSDVLVALGAVKLSEQEKVANRFAIGVRYRRMDFDMLINGDNCGPLTVTRIKPLPQRLRSALNVPNDSVICAYWDDARYFWEDACGFAISREGIWIRGRDMIRSFFKWQDVRAIKIYYKEIWVEWFDRDNMSFRESKYKLKRLDLQRGCSIEAAKKIVTIFTNVGINVVAGK